MESPFDKLDGMEATARNTADASDREMALRTVDKARGE